MSSTYPAHGFKDFRSWQNAATRYLVRRMNKKPYPRISVGIIVIRDKQVFLGKRRNSHGGGSWCFPGGHLEYGESRLMAANSSKEGR